jgi:hypothetical protein
MRQGEPSVATGVDGGAPRCVYRNGAGLSCAVGCLIPDDLYVPEMDQVDGLRWTVGRVAEALGLGRHAGLLSELQKVHDDYYDKGTMKSWAGEALRRHWLVGLSQVAGRHGLRMQGAPW